MKSRIGFFALVGLAFIGVGFAPSVEANTITPPTSSLSPLTPPNLTVTSLPGNISAQITAAIKSGNPQTLINVITQLINANPSLTGSILNFAVLNDPNAAPQIAKTGEDLVGKQGGNPGDVTVIVVAALESLVLPAAGPGATGLTQDQIAALIGQVINPQAGGPSGGNPNSSPTYAFGLFLPPPSPH